MISARMAVLGNGVPGTQRAANKPSGRPGPLIGLSAAPALANAEHWSQTKRKFIVLRD